MRPTRWPVLTWCMRLPISVRACYALSGTARAYGAICLQACCAMAGTACCYLPTRLLRAVRYCRSASYCAAKSNAILVQRVGATVAYCFDSAQASEDRRAEGRHQEQTVPALNPRP
eukprot:3758184-Rhodomonas_salina.4